MIIDNIQCRFPTIQKKWSNILCKFGSKIIIISQFASWILSLIASKWYATELNKYALGWKKNPVCHAKMLKIAHNVFCENVENHASFVEGLWPEFHTRLCNTLQFYNFGSLLAVERINIESNKSKK